MSYTEQAQNVRKKHRTQLPSFRVGEFRRLTKSVFEKRMRALLVKDKISTDKAKALAESEKLDLMHFIVRNRGPILLELVPSTVDDSWLNACGYLYTTKGTHSGLTFRHTCEHNIK